MNRRKAYDYATREVDLLFPPPPVEPAPEPAAVVEVEPPPVDPAPVAPDTPAPVPDQPAAVDQAPTAATPPPSSASGVQGLGDIPEGWPPLPANASLAAEVSWVQANRLRVKQGEGVDLSRALSPAPSHASLGWLETSLLYPSKFADVAVKASAEHQDAAEDVRRERIALADVAALLAEACSSATS